MPRLPIPGSDDGSWGDVLNDYLLAAHNSDGTLKGGIPQSKVQDLSSNMLAKANAADLSAHIAATTDIHGISDAANLETKTGAQAKVDAHITDATAAHAASAIAFTPTGAISATNVQDALVEVASEGGGVSGAVMATDYGSNSILKADADDTPIALSIGASTLVGRAATGGIAALTPASVRSLLSITDKVRFSADIASTGTTGTDRADTERTITEVRMRCGIAPIGSDLVVVIEHYNGASWTEITTATIADGSATEAVVSALAYAQSAGDLLRLNITSIGSTTAANDVVVDVYYTV